MDIRCKCQRSAIPRLALLACVVSHISYLISRISRRSETYINNLSVTAPPPSLSRFLSLCLSLSLNIHSHWRCRYTFDSMLHQFWGTETINEHNFNELIKDQEVWSFYYSLLILLIFNALFKNPIKALTFVMLFMKIFRFNKISLLVYLQSEIQFIDITCNFQSWNFLSAILWLWLILYAYTYFY